MNTYECGYQLSDSLRYRMLAHSFELGFKQYVSLKGTRVGLQSAHCTDEVIKTIMRDLINPALEINMYLFVKFGPNDEINEHVDDSLLRRSCITWALAPQLINFAPVTYGSEDISYSNFPLILNTQANHEMHNNEFERTSFQLCLSEDINQLAEMDQAGQLFMT